MALATASNVELTPDDVLDLPDGISYELVDGRLKEREMSSLSTFVATRLSRLLGNHCDDSGMAYVFTEGATSASRAERIGCVGPTSVASGSTAWHSIRSAMAS